MKKLPSIFKNNINKKINNNKKICYINIDNNTDITNNTHNINKINQVLDKIFNGLGYSYNIPVYIKTLNKEYNTSIVIRNKLNIVTIDNDLIPIKDIIDIKIK